MRELFITVEDWEKEDQSIELIALSEVVPT